MPKIESELIKSPYTQKEETFYKIYLDTGKLVASTYDQEEAYGKYYNMALRIERTNNKKREQEIAANTSTTESPDTTPQEIENGEDESYNNYVNYAKQQEAEKEKGEESTEDKSEEDSKKEKKKHKFRYFTPDLLEKALGLDGLKQLESITINPGKAFMSGQSTNVVFSNSANTANNLNANGLNSLGNITSGIGANLTSNIGNYTSGLAGGAIENITSNAVTGKIGSLASGSIGKVSSKVTSLSTSVLSKGTNKLSSLNTKLMNTTAMQDVNAVIGAAGNVTAALTPAASLGLGAYSYGNEMIKNMPQMVTSLAMLITNKVIEVLSKEITKKGTEYLTNHLKAIQTLPMKVQSYAMAYFNANKMSIGDALKKLLETSEDRKEKKNKEKNSKNLNSFISKCQEKSQNFISYINKYTDMGISYINMVTAYMQNGSEWITEQLDKQMCNLVDMVTEQVNKQWAKDKELYDEKIESLGEALGSEMVKVYDKNVENAQKKLQEKIEKNKKKATIKLSVTKAKAASKLGSMLGMYIPVPDMV